MANMLNLGIGSPALINKPAPSRGIVDLYKDFYGGLTGSGTNLFSGAPSQLEQIKFREQEDDIVNMMGGMPEYTGLPPALGSYEARQISPGEFKSRFGSPSFGQSPGLAIGDDSEAIQQKLEDIRIDKNIATDPKGGDKSLEGGEEAIAHLFDTSIKGYMDRMRKKETRRGYKRKNHSRI